MLSILLKNVSYLLEKKQEIAACLDVLGDIIVGLQHLNKVMDALRDLVSFLQFKKREKYPWRSSVY